MALSGSFPQDDRCKYLHTLMNTDDFSSIVQKSPGATIPLPPCTRLSEASITNCFVKVFAAHYGFQVLESEGWELPHWLLCSL